MQDYERIKLTYPCRRCMVNAGDRCVTKSGKVAAELHWDRHQQALEDGTLPVYKVNKKGDLVLRKKAKRRLET